MAESKAYLIQDDLGKSLQSQIVPIPVPVLSLPGSAKVTYGLLKVVDNEKWEGLRGWLLVEGDTGPWRSMSVYF